MTSLSSFTLALALVLALPVHSRGIFSQAIKEAMAPKPTREEIGAALSQAAATLNAKLPQQIDEETVLVTVIVLPASLQLIYNYKMILHTKKELDTAHFAFNMREELVPRVCGDKNTRPLIENDATMVYSYYDKTMTQVARIRLTKAACKDISYRKG